jgi:fructose-bisphosphate aldolase class II
MSHVTLKEVLVDARKRHYAVPCLGGINLEAIIGIVKAAEEKRSPLILCFNKQLTPDIPIEITMPILVNIAELSKIPIATILDHGSDLDLIKKSIEHGSSSVMFDGSGLSFEENVKRTREVVELAHPKGVSVEAELGGVGGSAVEAVETGSAESLFTVPEEAKKFVELTDVDCLAISFGNVHGKYKGEPRLDLERVKKIFETVEIPLGMHGASGLTEYDYKPIILSGISKLNYFSAMCRNIYPKLKALVESAGEDVFCLNMISMSIDFWYNEAKKLLDICMCSGKAGGSQVDIKTSDGLPEDVIRRISVAIAEEVKRNLR